MIEYIYIWGFIYIICFVPWWIGLINDHDHWQKFYIYLFVSIFDHGFWYYINIYIYKIGAKKVSKYTHILYQKSY